MLSGTESNRGTKCIPRLARFNPRLALIGFLGTRARGQPGEVGGGGGGAPGRSWN